MFTPRGYLPIPLIVAWLADVGGQGKLPAHLGFVRPGETADALDLSAEDTARFVLGELLVSGAIVAQAIFDESGKRMAISVEYWARKSAMKTMETGNFDLRRFGVYDDTARVILDCYQVAAALGFRLAPPEITAAPALPVHPPPAAPAPAVHSGDDAFALSAETAAPASHKQSSGLNYQPNDKLLARAIIVAGDFGHYRSDWDGCLDLAELAEGTKNLESRAKRLNGMVKALRRQILRLLSSEQPE